MGRAVGVDFGDGIENIVHPKVFAPTVAKYAVCRPADDAFEFC